MRPRTSDPMNIRPLELLFALLLVSLLAGCAAGGAHHSAAPARIAPLAAPKPPDWTGSFQGTLPCADCVGIRTRVQLAADASYRLERLHLGRTDTPAVEEGVYSVDEPTRIITLTPSAGEATRYLAGGDRLFALDADGQRIRGDLEAHYHLLRETAAESADALAAISGRWRVAFLVGVAPDALGEIVISFGQDGSLVAESACGQRHASFRLAPAGSIRMTPLTPGGRCAGDVGAARLAVALRRSDAFSLVDGELVLMLDGYVPQLRARPDGAR